ncbi:tetratricopeptide repeat protein [Caenimonas sedimenti]|uniref:Ancillary SecYEG translocon subunit n=1 Tax=Caenimonas sedimenti TaxID=2596921 RepID=A0A562ZG82_9BURK|nr:tetratricopeptide repeat protein [Caenimonas sedimenti]TWO66975.1 tetratricopeptide repeat protein [Caenimonas sedimenti]
MARHLDLEEQEQLDELKHFWNKWGNAITWFLIAALGSFAAWNGWQFWQRNQAAQASVLYDEVDRAAGAGDAVRVERAFKDIKDKFGGTVYAEQAALMAAKTLAEKGQLEPAKAALQWVAADASDQGYKALARLRLASLWVESKNYDEAHKQLAGAFPKEFEALAADRRGDVYNLQGKKTEAKAEYTKAWQGLDEQTDYRMLVEVKLTALGVDVQALKPPAPAAAAASGSAKS